MDFAIAQPNKEVDKTLNDPAFTALSTKPELAPDFFTLALLTPDTKIQHSV